MLRIKGCTILAAILVVFLVLSGCSTSVTDDSTPTNVEDTTDDPIDDPVDDPVDDPIDDPIDDPVEVVLTYAIYSDTETVDFSGELNAWGTGGVDAVQTELTTGGSGDGENFLRVVYAGASNVNGSGFSFKSTAPVDLSSYASGSIKFFLKVAADQVDPVIAIERGVYADGDHRVTEIVLQSGQYGFVKDGNWHQVTIPVQDFLVAANTALHGKLFAGDLQYLVGLFQIRAGNNQSLTVEFDNVYWTAIGTNEDDPVDETPSTIVYPATNPDTYSPGIGWNIAWQDNFNTFDTNVWTRQAMFYPYNDEWQHYTDDAANSYVYNGYLVLKAIHTSTTHAFGHYTSARLISNPGGVTGATTQAGKTMQYGKIAARIQLPEGKGIWPAFWMLGDNTAETGGDINWPQCGEIDILESGGANYANFGQGTVTGALHYDPTVENIEDGGGYLCLDSASHTLPNNELLAEKFHVYEIEWTPTQIIWRVDGVQSGVKSISEAGYSEFHQQFYILLNVAVSGWYTVDPDNTTPFPVTMYVDWIRHYTN